MVGISLSWPWKHFTVYICFWICTKQPESNLTGLQPNSCQFVSFDFFNCFWISIFVQTVVSLPFVAIFATQVSVSFFSYEKNEFNTWLAKMFVAYTMWLYTCRLISKQSKIESVDFWKIEKKNSKRNCIIDWSSVNVLHFAVYSY